MIFDSKQLLVIASLATTSLLMTAVTTRATQVVYLDFISRTTAGEIQYTTAQRNAIQSRMELDYALFDFQFTQAAPVSGDFSTLFFNSGQGLGLAEQIDFRNLDRNDTAQIQITGAVTSSPQIITLSANTASHELGHLLGLRHGDSFGPIGSGRDPNTAFANEFRPSYPGPAGADETRFHIMEADNNPSGFIESTTRQYFSERSAIKLAFNEIGTVIAEAPGANDSIASAQPISLVNMPVPNTLLAGDNFGEALFVEALAVTGMRSSTNDDDYYSFQGFAGDLFNIEVISDILDYRIANTIDPTLTLLGPNGLPVNYYGTSAFNDDEWEGLDSILLDIVLPSDGTYTILVDAFDSTDTGGYELFLYRLASAPVPEPSAWVLLVGLSLFAAWKNR